MGVQITITATVGGVSAPMDAGLGGRLFKPWTVESPSNVVAGWSSPAGQSSVQRFTPDRAGHYVLGLQRAAGGAVLLAIDVKTSW